MIRISTATRLLDIYWPTFTAVGDGVFLGADLPSAEGSPPPVDALHSIPLIEAEWSQTHTHIFDHFRHTIPKIHDAAWDIYRPDPTHPEFEEAWRLAKTIGQMWLAKLQVDFPRDRFCVYVTKFDDPIVRFHKLRVGEEPYLSDEDCASEIARGEMAIYTTLH